MQYLNRKQRQQASKKTHPHCHSGQIEPEQSKRNAPHQKAMTERYQGGDATADGCISQRHGLQMVQHRLIERNAFMNMNLRQHP